MQSVILVAQLLVKDSTLINSLFKLHCNTLVDDALVGCGSFPSLGQVTYPHQRVLFLDELAEFKSIRMQDENPFLHFTF